MIHIYTPVTLIEGQCLKDMLHSKRIHSHLSGVDLTGAMGELPAIGLLGLYVPAEDALLAKQLIDDYLSATPILDEP
ncbi:DUF2007 domain-containing protein [uncultured Endozoicomonas sp.]|uniref:DUF2007 domain-containing protein n=1 Tax=uncultured Endozoicomonas sp. TaxID=432652 RepID=UPI002612A321|nr:DUF2007 domain-containing protein [uncultured Endozoicomonas sp.]